MTTSSSESGGSAAPASRRSLAKFAIPLLVLVAAAAYGVHWWTAGRFRETTDDAYVASDLTVIAPKVAGYIVDLPAADNQFVHAGDLLVRLDDRDYKAGLARSAGTVDAQVAALENLDARTALQKAVISRAQAEIEAAGAEATRSREDFLRYKDLVSRASVSVESAQRAEASSKAADANLQKAKAELEAARRQLDVIATQKQQASAVLAQVRADQDLARLNLGYTDIRAPIDGYVGNRKARVGAYAAAGSQLLSIVPSAGMWIDANFKEDQLARMQVGQPATIRADTLPGKTMHGHLESLAPATGAQFSILPPENATGNFTKIVQRVPIRVKLDASDAVLEALRPGLSVQVVVDTAAGGPAARIGDKTDQASAR